MNPKKTLYLLVNFGGPRDAQEICCFLYALLTDQDVIRTSLPAFLHRLIFSRIAKKRAAKIVHDYELIGGRSPIFADTEAVAAALRRHLDCKQWNTDILTFHRYLPRTHDIFLDAIKKVDAEEIRIFPFFPQFSYATTGSIARWFSKHLCSDLLKRMCWVKSYNKHPAYIALFQQIIRKHLKQHQLKENEVVLFYSAHGVPQKFVDSGDPYEEECRSSFKKISAGFPEAINHLAYQSKFGRGEWIRPYTNESCEQILSWNEGRNHVVFIPLSFTSDHIETLFEVEELYLPILRKKGLNATRCPAFNCCPDWIEAIAEILREEKGCSNEMLIRPLS